MQKDDEKLKKLLEENLKATKEVREMTRYIRKYVIISQIIGVLKIILIVVPIVLGIIYLPPIIKEFVGQYCDLI
ncbi:MAG: hypothetical protein U5L10_01530 [Candidatus Moranbacteria bacterium]|nr:hypothetical protein [Candidatus Moranbacteria bacterium]